MGKQFQNERGFAIIVVLAVLFMLGLVGVAAIRTTSTDMDISKSMTERTKSFYAAEGGLELAVATMEANPTMVDADSLLGLVKKDSMLGDGYFEIEMSNDYPIRPVVSVGHDRDGESAVAVDVRHRRTPINAWNNAIFAGVGQTGVAVAGNVDIHGSVHILGDGEPFTDKNGNGTWDDDDEFTDLNSNSMWDPGEPLTVDHDGDGLWDPAEPFTDDNGNGSYDETLTATDLAFEAAGTAAVQNSYAGMGLGLSSRVPPLTPIWFNGENVESLDAEVRVKHGVVNLSGTAQLGDADVSGGSPAIKETVDGVYVNDGFGGDAGEANIYSDNGTSQLYDLPEDAIKFPSLNDSSHGYADHRAYLADNALIIPGDLTLRPGESYISPISPKGALSMDLGGNLTITGIVVVTGNVYLEKGSGKDGKKPILYDGRGTLVSGGDMHINNHLLSNNRFPTDDVMGLLSFHNMEIGTSEAGAQLAMTGAFFAQQTISSARQNQLAGAMVSNYFSVSDVPSIYHVPTLVENLPPGMPGGVTIVTHVWKALGSTWREIYPVY